jgi:hypothetical protein
MKQTIDINIFKDTFRNYGRQDQFSSRGLELLFDYLEELENDTGDEMELDVIGLCCDWTESSLTEVLKEYDLDSLEDLQDSTQVIVVDDETVIYNAF